MTAIERSGKAVATEDPDRIEYTGWTAAEIWRRVSPFLVTVVNLTCFFIIWQLFASSGAISPLFFPTATAMFKELWHGLTTTAPPGAVVSGSIRDHLF
jgi:ABC-type nitrate/sulfonate/bicarbonate transport system permease component